MTSGAFSAEVKASALMRAGYRCEACGTNPVTEFHHRLSRQMGGSKEDFVAAVTNCLALCSTCHRYITENPRKAYEYGWMVRRGIERPAAVPVYVKDTWGRRRWVLLTWDGRYEEHRTDPLAVVR
ncbi:MAG: hypothetical protein ACOYY2_12930 [Actinomycetota bacterium]